MYDRILWEFPPDPFKEHALLCDLRGWDVMVLLVLVSVKKELFRVGFFGEVVGGG